MLKGVPGRWETFAVELPASDVEPLIDAAGLGASVVTLIPTRSGNGAYQMRR